MARSPRAAHQVVQFDLLLVGPKVVRNSLRSCWLLCALIVLCACGSGNSDPPRISSVVVSPDSVTLTALDATVRLEATARDSDGNNISAVFAWSSSDTTIATVDTNGSVTAVANGVATITASSNRISASVTITVQQQVSSVAISPNAVNFAAIDGTVQLEAEARDANDHAMTATFRWESSDAAIAAVDANGLVRALRNGEATISAVSDGALASVAVTVRQQVSSVTVSPNTVTLAAINETVQMAAAARDANGNLVTAVVGWSSSDTAVATVDAAGLVTALTNGITTVTASTGAFSASVTVTVQQQVSGVTVSPHTVTFASIDETAQLGAEARDANGHVMSVHFDWMTSDTSVATVDTGGLVTAQGDGVARITVISGGFSASVTVTVAQIASLTVSPDHLRFEALDDSAQLEAIARDANGDPASVEFRWSSSDPSVAMVDATGRVTARRNGAATVFATSGEFTASTTVTVEQQIRELFFAPTGDDVDPVRFNSLGETVQFSIEALDSNGYPIPGYGFTAISVNPDIVMIDEDFLATATGNGTTRIWFNDRTTEDYLDVVVAETVVNVRQIAARAAIEPAARTFRRVNETHQFTANAWDANGYPLPSEFLSWESADRRVADVDSTGSVIVRGNGETEIVVRADDSWASAAVSGELEVTCAAGPRAPSIITVQPESLVEGASITIQGTGFCGNASGNLVTIDGMVADVVGASETALRVSVPQYHCLPTREVELTVAVGTHSVTRFMEVRPDEPAISLPVGQQAIIGAGKEKCVQFAKADESESYLIGVQSTLLGFTDEFTEVRLTTVTAEPDNEGPVSNDRWHAPSQRHAPANLQQQALAAPPQMIGLNWQLEPADVRMTDTASSVILGEEGFDRPPEVGDIVAWSGNEWLVHTIGTHALWLVRLELVEYMEREYPTRVAELSNGFDSQVYPPITDFFGTPDFGNVGRLVVFINPEHFDASVNPVRGRKFSSVNFGLTNTFTALAHEFTHVIQIPLILDDRPPQWFIEGQADLGAEIFGFSLMNRSSAQNYGRDVAFDDQPGNAWWSNFQVIGLGFFGGGAHPERPQECVWIVGRGSCGGPLPYAVGWSFLRYLTDQYGSQYPGGERYLHQELIQPAPEEPLEATIERLLGESIETLLARWAAALYVDDRIADADSTLQFTSWNLWNIFSNQFIFSDQFPLVPLEIPFTDLERKARIRDGSMWYLRVSDEERAATAIRIRDQADRALSYDIQVWVVRLE